MALRAGLLGVLIAIMLPAVAVGQERSCRQVLPSDARRLVNAQGEEIIYFRDPVRILCTGGLRLEADSAIMNRATASVRMVGNVVFQDSIQRLTTDWANYIGERDQLLARGDVELLSLEDGSTVEGDELDYLRASESRPQARMVVRGRRPYAVIPPRADSGAVVDTAASTEVWADRMEFEGEEAFRGLGNVELRRGTMTGAADTATFRQLEERMTLIGDAVVRTDQYRLDGATIDAYLDGNAVRTVVAEQNARVESDELIVEAERIRIGLSGGELDRMEAWNPEPASVPRVVADAEGFRLRADSIDARADSIGLEEVRAVGRAFGERDVDSPAREMPDAVSRDWIQGDTILGFFTRRVGGAVTDTVAPDTAPAMAPVPPGANDSVEVALERIVVIGGQQPALSLYRMRQEDGGPEPAINFVKALRITLFLEKGDVRRVEMDGPLDGLYLAPAPGNDRGGDGSNSTPTGERSVQADGSGSGAPEEGG